MPGSKKKRLKPIHPGEVLQEVLDEAGLTVNALALRCAYRRTASARSSRSAWDHRRHGPSARTLFQDIRPEMDESPGQVRMAAAEDSLSDQIEGEVLPRSAA